MTDMPPLPRYRQIADELAAQITSGRYTTGALLPGEMELCEHYGVSRHTARDALRLLQDRGLIRRRRGSGTVVVDPAEAAGPFAQEWGDVRDIQQYARDARLVIRSIEPATATLLETLSLSTDVAWITLRGLRIRAGGTEPLALTQICVDAQLLPSRADIDAWSGALADLIDSRGGPTTRTVEQTITAVLLDREEARLLGARTGDPALCTVRRYRDADGRLFQASHSVHPAGRFAYHMVVER